MEEILAAINGTAASTVTSTSSNAGSILVCPSIVGNNNNNNNNEDDDSSVADTLVLVMGVLTFLGSAIGYFWQEHRNRCVAAAAAAKEDADLDRAQALERVREQISVFVGPLHRLYKTHGTILAQYMIVNGHGLDLLFRAASLRGEAFWTTMLRPEFLEPFAEDPHSLEATVYRNMVTRRLRPVHTRIRELVMEHASDLADMPTQEEWLELYEPESVMSPHTGSVNVNVVFDSFSAWSLEFDDIVESWGEGDFRRMQPTTTVPFMICNELVDLLYDNAKAKEATYNKHVKVHKNTVQGGIKEQIPEVIRRGLVVNPLPVRISDALSSLWNNDSGALSSPTAAAATAGAAERSEHQGEGSVVMIDGINP